MGRTLSQVSTGLHIEGTWPSPISIRRGWARATARPWNDDVSDCSLRLIRGGHDFIAQATGAVRQIAGSRVLSPALYPSAARVWKRAGYGTFADLEVMERSLRIPVGTAKHEVTRLPTRVSNDLLELDRQAFEHFWRMGRAGLDEALSATPKAAVLATRAEDTVSGYALVGSQQSVSYLQRVAVLPQFAGGGLGTSLIYSALNWARGKGARTMVLNVRHQNVRARDLYQKTGFQDTRTKLELLEFSG